MVKKAAIGCCPTERVELFRPDTRYSSRFGGAKKKLGRDLSSHQTTFSVLCTEHNVTYVSSILHSGDLKTIATYQNCLVAPLSEKKKKLACVQ